MKIRTYFIEYHDTESAEIKLYVVGYSTGPAWLMYMVAVFVQYSIQKSTLKLI